MIYRKKRNNSLSPGKVPRRHSLLWLFEKVFFAVLESGAKMILDFYTCCDISPTFFYLFPKLHTVETSSDSNVWFLTSQLVFWKLQQVFTSRQYCSVVNFSQGCMKFLSNQNQSTRLKIINDRLTFLMTDGTAYFFLLTDLETLILYAKFEMCVRVKPNLVTLIFIAQFLCNLVFAISR